MIIAFFFIFGAVVGSFLNVCITRIPEDLSIVRPGSRCPRCGTPVKPYDNVPVLAWLWLRGKCRACGKPISALYPLVELLTALLFVACYLEYGLTLAMYKWLFLTCLLIVLAITDVRVRLLPDDVNWFGFGVGLVFGAFVPVNDGAALSVFSHIFHAVPSDRVLGVADALLGAAFGSLLLWGAAALYKLLRKRDGMGLGDVKMMVMVGSFLGVRGAFLTILLGTLLGSVLGLALIAALYVAGWQRALAVRASRRGLGSVAALHWTIVSQYQLPLGTFLAAAALLIIYLAPLFATYMSGLSG